MKEKHVVFRITNLQAGTQMGTPATVCAPGMASHWQTGCSVDQGDHALAHILEMSQRPICGCVQRPPKDSMEERKGDPY